MLDTVCLSLPMFYLPVSTQLCGLGGWFSSTASRAFCLVFGWVQLKEVTAGHGREEERWGRALIFLLPPCLAVGQQWHSPMKDRGSLLGVLLHSHGHSYNYSSLSNH